MGEALTESLRNLELPKIQNQCSAVEFGDWLAIVGPLMADLSGTSSHWWALVMRAANTAYTTWTTSTPLERLRQRVALPPEAARWPRTEQRAVTMLLAAVPDSIRRELIAARKLNTVEIVFALLCRFQPGGSQERASLLRDISDPKLNQNASVHELLAALRLWRRNLGRARELGLQLPDPLILVNLLTRWSDHLGRHGGAQLVYRVASLRQALALDTFPTATSVLEFSEAVHAEAEQLALSMTSSSTTSTSGTHHPPSLPNPEKPKKENPKAAALKTPDSPTNAGDSPKPKCKFWGSPVGCKRGEQCKFLHSWDGMQRKGKCWNCSAEGHMKPDCPYLKSKDASPSAGNGKDKVAKVKGPKSGEKDGGTPKVNEGGNPTSSRSSTFGTLSTSASTSSSPTEEKPKTVIIEDVTETASTNLMSDISGLVKSLQSLKAVQLRYVDAGGGEDPHYEGRVALLDGGATHALRQGDCSELKGAEAVTVELACGTTTLYRKKGCSTLLSKEKIETILPMRLLIDHGYKVVWSANGCTITHPAKGPLRCWRRQGCPVMKESEALVLLEELERLEEKGESEEILHYWQLRDPNVPTEVFKYMRGQGEDWSKQPGVLPWNRHRRRQLENAKGIIVHLFSGTSTRTWDDLRSAGWEVVCLDIANNSAENVHNPAVWAYLWSLAKKGLVKALLGGPPCRTFSRLRHQRPGPRPLRGRSTKRWALEGLSAAEREQVHSDSALVLKMFALYDVMVESVESKELTVFLLEHPEDPMNYVDSNSNEDVYEYPSVWEWPELHSFADRHLLQQVAFDQSRTGHVRCKPTRLLTSLAALSELDGLRHQGGPVESMKKDLPSRLRQTSSWAEWSPGLIAAVKAALSQWMDGCASLCKMTMSDWKAHVQRGHVPFRRDCRLCVETMGQDVPHRRQRNQGGNSVYILSVDIAGPYHSGWDYGESTEAKYALIATVPIPRGSKAAVDVPLPQPSLPGEPQGPSPEVPRAGQAQDAEDALLAERALDGDMEALQQYLGGGVPLQGCPSLKSSAPADGSEDVLAGAPVLEPGEEEEVEWSDGEKKLAETMNAKWRREKAEAEEPVEIQNISLMQPLKSRATKDVVEALSRLHARYRALGIPMLRFHSDRAKEFISRPVRSWVASRQMWQTATCGDDAPSNGRIEAELHQWKRRLRLTLKSANAPVAEWPSVGRHVMEERTRSQLANVGLKMPPMVDYNKKVMVKTKLWHKRFTKGMASPYFQAKVKGPSPLMSHGWVVQDDKGKIQHARAVLVTDPNAEQAMLELEDSPRLYPHRLRGKQPVHPRVPAPQLVASGAAVSEEADDYEPESPLEVDPHGDVGPGEPMALRTLTSTLGGVPALCTGGGVRHFSIG